MPLVMHAIQSYTKSSYAHPSRKRGVRELPLSSLKYKAIEMPAGRKVYGYVRFFYISI